MHSFEHVNAASVDQAVELLVSNPLAWPIAGGTDLIPEMRLGIHTPGQLVNLKSIRGMDGIRVEADLMRLGALARLEDLGRDRSIQQRLPALAEAISLAASPQIRNSATLGGSICQESRCWYFRGPFHCWLKGGEICNAKEGENSHHAIFGGGPCFTVSPSDPAVALVAYDARVRWRSTKGDQRQPMAQFFTLPTTEHRSLTTLSQGDVVVDLEVPWPPDGERAVFRKAMDRAAFSWALASAVVRLQMDGSRVGRAHVVLGGVAPIPWRAGAAERALQGQELNAGTIEAAAAAATQGAQSLALNAYKVPLVQGLVRQALSDLT